MANEKLVVLSLTTENWIQIGVGVVALISLVYSVISSLYLRNKQDELQERMVLIEESKEKERQREKDKADVYFWLKRKLIPNRRGPRPNDYLYLENRGQATAENVAILIDDTPILEHPAFTSNRKGELLTIDPGVPAVQYLCSGEPRPPYIVEVKWTNKSGESNSRKRQVHLEMA